MDKDCALIEKYTRKQSKSTLWKKQRLGAVTASILHKVANYVGKQRNVGNEEDNYVVKIILGLSEFEGNAATTYGLHTENLARRLYAQHLKQCHTDTCVMDCGLLVSQNNPIFRQPQMEK